MPLHSHRAHEFYSLRERIRRQYTIVTEPMVLGDLSFDFTRVTNPDAVLDQVAAAEDVRTRLSGTHDTEPLHLPYWAELWDSAFAMARHIADHHEIFADQLVLDLGCGQGLSGVAAAYCGASVTFADLEAPALLFARLNSLGSKNHCRARRLNWQRDRLGEQFDFILGADILYERSQWPFLNQFWHAHLKTAGQIWLGEPGRPTGEGFLQYAVSTGWRIEQDEQSLPGRNTPIRIFKLQRGE